MFFANQTEDVLHPGHDGLNGGIFASWNMHFMPKKAADVATELDGEHRKLRGADTSQLKPGSG